MLNTDTFDFLIELSKNNNKEWFDKNRPQFNTIKENLNEIAQKIINKLEIFDEQIRYKGLQPKNCIFRINKDVRFSKDKSPYKTNFAMHFDLGSKAVSGSTYYIQIAPVESLIGGGVYIPMAPELFKIRKAISEKYDDFKKIILSIEFTKYFPEGVTSNEVLKTIPRGFKKEDPAIEFLRMKGYIATKEFTQKELIDKDCLDKIINHFQALKPLNHFLNRAIIAEI